jgi:hypothetical protein
MKTYLEVLEARMREVEEQIRREIDDPCLGAPHGHISASCDFVRQLFREAEAAGERVEHQPDSPFYFLNGLRIKADGNLPKGSFMIELVEGT